MRVVRVVLSRLKSSVTNDMHVTIDPRPVQPVNPLLTTCTGRTSRTRRVKPFTGRICSTVLDKDVSSKIKSYLQAANYYSTYLGKIHAGFDNQGCYVLILSKCFPIEIHSVTSKTCLITLYCIA